MEIKLSPESEEILKEITQEVERKLKPLYDQLGVDMRKEELHWTNGEVFVINKKTRKRREIAKEQRDLNNTLFLHAVEIANEKKEN